ncbi:MAG: hypothetical protein EBR09_12790 [Proteobacteria bacterium]|nr:hypothetical protein [Pseudomonadota bacterium]
MAWKKPKWVSDVQKKADNAVKPITTAAPVKAVQKAAEKVVQAVTPPPMPKPAIVQNIQNAAQKAADNVGQGLKDAAKDTGAAIQKAGDVVRPAAQQSGAALDRIGDKLKGAVNQPQANAGGNDNFEFLPYFTNKMPGAVIDMGKGLFNTAAGIVTADGQRVLSGLKTTGSGIVDAAKHTGLGTLEVIGLGGGRGTGKTYTNRGSTVEEYEDKPTTGQTVASGGESIKSLPQAPSEPVEKDPLKYPGKMVASGGAAVSAIPVPGPDIDEPPPPGSTGTAGPGNPALPKTPAPGLGLTSDTIAPFTPVKQKKKEKPSTLDKIREAIKLPKKRRK